MNDSNNSLHDSLTKLISAILSDLGVMTIFWSLTILFGRNVQLKMMKETYTIYRKINKSKLHHEQIKNMMQNWLILKRLIDLQPKR
jgi:hypothetical protein